MQNDQLRLELVRVVLPHASKLDMNSPERIIGVCRALEDYVNETVDAENKNSQDTDTRPRKRRKAGEVAPSPKDAG